MMAFVGKKLDERHRRKWGAIWKTEKKGLIRHLEESLTADVTQEEVTTKKRSRRTKKKLGRAHKMLKTKKGVRMNSITTTD